MQWKCTQPRPSFVCQFKTFVSSYSAYALYISAFLLLCDAAENIQPNQIHLLFHHPTKYLRSGSGICVKSALRNVAWRENIRAHEPVGTNQIETHPRTINTQSIQSEIILCK